MKKFSSIVVFLIAFAIVLAGLPQTIRSDEDDNIPLPTSPEKASDYLQTWKHESYTEDLTITISATEFHRRSTFGSGSEYKLLYPVWTEVICPDDIVTYLGGFDVENYKGVSGYAITGTVNRIHGNWPVNGISITEYVFLNKYDKTKMLWHNFGNTNRELTIN